MQELLTQYPGILLAMIGLAFAEWAWIRLYLGRAYDARSSLASVAVAAGQALIKPLTGGVILLTYFALYAFAPLKLPIDSIWVWIAGFFAVEFAYYWFHRWSHRVNWLWATHAVHHSANELTFPAAIRLGWTGVISGGWLMFVPLVLIGFPPKMIAILLAANLLYQFLLHTETVGKLGPVEWVLNTPSHHRAHHSSDNGWLDCNFGGVVIFYDRLFGTFVEEPDSRSLRYGLTDPIGSHNPFTIAFRQWRIMLRECWLADSWARRWKALFGLPADLERLRDARLTAINE